MFVCTTCGKIGGHGYDICPNRLSVPDRIAAKKAEHRKRAEKIARRALDGYAYVPGDRLGFNRAVEVATAAALIALEESETTR